MNYSSGKETWNKLEKNNPTIAIDVLQVKKEKKCPAYVSKHKSKRLKQIVLLMSSNIKRLHVGLSQLRKHKFSHSFRDSLNAICICGNAIKSTSTIFSTAPISRMKVTPAKC